MVLDVVSVFKNTHGKKSKCFWCGTRQSPEYAIVPDMDGTLCHRCFCFAEGCVLHRLPKVSKDTDPLILKIQIMLSTQPLTALEFEYWSVTIGNHLWEGSQKALQRCIELKIMDWFENHDGEIDLDSLSDPINFERLQLFAHGSAPSMASEKIDMEPAMQILCTQVVNACKAIMFEESDKFSAPNDEMISNLMIDTVLELVRNDAAKGDDHNVKDFLVTGRTFDLDKERVLVNLD